jgi:hypothetical protein
MANNFPSAAYLPAPFPCFPSLPLLRKGVAASSRREGCFAANPKGRSNPLRRKALPAPQVSTLACFLAEQPEGKKQPCSAGERKQAALLRKGVAACFTSWPASTPEGKKQPCFAGNQPCEAREGLLRKETGSPLLRKYAALYFVRSNPSVGQRSSPPYGKKQPASLVRSNPSAAYAGSETALRTQPFPCFAREWEEATLRLSVKQPSEAREGSW